MCVNKNAMTIRYARGTVWMCEDECFDNESLRKGFRTHVQKNSRPALILSSDFGNTHSPVVNVIPITSQSKPCSVNVQITLEDGSTNYIMCNQIKTVDASSLNHYMYCVSDDVISEVEKTIQTVLGISQPKIAKSFEDLEQLINNITTMKFNELSNRDEFDAIVTNVVNGLENTYKNLMQNYISNINASARRLREQSPCLSESIQKKLNCADNNSVNTVNSTKYNNVEIDVSSNHSDSSNDNKLTNHRKTSGSKKPRGYWTEERKRQYVADYDNHTIEWMMINYEIDTPEQATKKRHQYHYELKRDAKKAK